MLRRQRQAIPICRKIDFYDDYFGDAITYFLFFSRLYLGAPHRNAYTAHVESATVVSLLGAHTPCMGDAVAQNGAQLFEQNGKRGSKELNAICKANKKGIVDILININ